jgi:F-type H+/Na+-transporting ATPase subunit alpha
MLNINNKIMNKNDQANIIENFVSYGKVLTCKDGIIEIAGLRDVMAGEVVKLGSEQICIIFNLKNNSDNAIVLGDYAAIVQ